MDGPQGLPAGAAGSHSSAASHRRVDRSGNFALNQETAPANRYNGHIRGVMRSSFPPAQEQQEGVEVIESQAIEKVVRAFVKGLQEGDIALLAQHFTRDALIHRYEGGRCESRSPEDFLATLEPLPSPDVAGMALQGLEHGGDVAHVYVRHAADGATVTDYLALEKVAGQWKIASRSFHLEPAGAIVAPGRQAA